MNEYNNLILRNFKSITRFLENERILFLDIEKTISFSRDSADIIIRETGGKNFFGENNLTKKEILIKLEKLKNN